MKSSATLKSARERMDLAIESVKQAAFGKCLNSNKLVENVVSRKNGWEHDWMTLHVALPFNQSKLMTELLEAMKHLAKTEKRERDQQEIRNEQRFR